MNWWWILLTVVALLACGVLGVLFCLRPRQHQTKLETILQGRYANRGLFNGERGVPENSLKAFRYAVTNGFGAKMEVRLTKDKKPVVMADSDLKRMCGQEGLVEQTELRQLRQMTLGGTSQKIPTLEEALAVFEEKQPVILELKTGRGSCRELCTRVCAILEHYRGDFCIVSYDPRVLRWLRRNEPFILRGLMVEAFDNQGAAEQLGGALRLLPGLLGNVQTRPDFIACRYEGRNNVLLRLCSRGLGARELYWVIRDQSALDTAEGNGAAGIFEGFLPAKKQEPPTPAQEECPAEETK